MLSQIFVHGKVTQTLICRPNKSKKHYLNVIVLHVKKSRLLYIEKDERNT